MYYKLRSKLESHPILADLTFALFFGVLSLALGELKIVIPGIEGVQQTDFREIPLIISVFYIRNPLWLFVLCLVTILVFPFEGSYLSAYLMHVGPLIITWFFYKNLNKITNQVLSKGLIWLMFVFFYYAVLLIPTMIFIDQLVGLNKMEFGKSYMLIIASVKFEAIPTAIITGLYLVQVETRENLRGHQKNLEKIVSSRTEELETANDRLIKMNKELSASSLEIKSMNENLDSLVKERSKKIEDQLGLLIKYTHMNSHEVRGPLARILGLLEVIKLDPELSDAKNVVNELCSSGEELDEIIKNMNRLLEKEIPNGDA